jgi:peroxiredoxin
MQREIKKHMTYDEQMQILNMVEVLVTQYPEMQTRVIERCTRGMQNRYESVNEMRTDAETAVVMLLDLVPKSKQTQEKHQYALTLAKRAVVRSGMFAGSVMANNLEAELKAEPHGA